MRFIFWFLLFTNLTWSQNTDKWVGYFSFSTILTADADGKTVAFAADNAVFLYNSDTESTQIISSINDFKAPKITALYYNDALQIVIAGNANGLVIVYDLKNKIATNLVDIVNKANIAANKKKINQITFQNNRIYLSTDYGISVVNLNTYQFEDTYFIGDAGEEISVLNTVFFEDKIIALTKDFGLKYAFQNNPNLIEYQQWKTYSAERWLTLCVFNNQLLGGQLDKNIYKINNGNKSLYFQCIAPAISLKAYPDYLCIATGIRGYALQQNGQLAQEFFPIDPQFNPYTSAVMSGTYYFAGTSSNGIVRNSIEQQFDNKDITPNGPLRNDIYSLQKSGGQIWAVYGDYSRSYNPYPLDNIGISNFKENKWVNIPFAKLKDAKSLTRVAINPSDANEVFISSFFSGLLQIKNTTDITLYNSKNTGSSGLESLVLSPPNPNYIDVRVNTPVFDSKGNLWMTNNRIENILKVRTKDGNWISHSFKDQINPNQNNSYNDLEIDKNNTKWLASANTGIIAFNEGKETKFKFIKNEFDKGNLPTNETSCIAIDKNNQLWIGTYNGLRVLPSVDQFLGSEDLKTKPIIIEENDQAQELFFQRAILDIVVDGANNKWIAVADGGVFLVSSDGKKIVANFTADNSPLPTNNVNDIEIDNTTGEVYFATEKGMVSYKAEATAASDNLSQVKVYPNPVTPSYSGTVKIANLTDGANVKIVDMAGNLVFEANAVGGVISWDTKAFGQHKVASGVYIIFIYNPDDNSKTTKKLMIIR